MPNPRLIAELTWPEFRDVVSRDPVVLVPCGATEQHGPHLPLGVDVYLSTAMALAVAPLCDGWVAPAIAYGYKSMPRSGGGAFFPGTVNLDGQTLSHIVRDITREYARHGVTKLVFFDGHFENQWFVTEGIDLALRELPRDSVRVIRFEYWDFFSETTLQYVFPSGDYSGIALEHAAVIETSLMMHFRPELVRESLVPSNPSANPPPYDVFPPLRHHVPESGALITAAGSSPDRGRVMAEQAAADIAAAIRSVFRGES